MEFRIRDLRILVPGYVMKISILEKKKKTSINLVGAILSHFQQRFFITNQSKGC